MFFKLFDVDIADIAGRVCTFYVSCRRRLKRQYHVHMLKVVAADRLRKQVMKWFNSGWKSITVIHKPVHCCSHFGMWGALDVKGT